MLIIDRDNGKIQAKLPSSGLTISANNQVNDRMYLASPEGLIVCLHETASKEPFLHPQTTTYEEAAPEQKTLAVKAGEKEKPSDDKPKPKVVPRKAPPKSKKKTGGDDDATDSAPKGKGKSKGGRSKKAAGDSDL
jgi:hypothetical protein